MSHESSEPGTHRSLSGLTRRTLMRRSAWLLGGAALATLLEACTVAPAAPPAVSTPMATKLVILDVGNMDTPEAAPRKQVLTDFMARNPDVTIDARALPSDIQWDRVARTTVSAGEQVDLLNINGLFIRAWVRDNLLHDLSTHSQSTASFGNVDPSFLAAQSDDPRHPFALPVIHASPVHVTALFYNKALLDKAGLQPPRTLADMKAMVQPLKAIGAVPLVHPAGEVSWNPLLVMWIQPMLVNNQPMEFTQKALQGDVKYNGPEWIKTFDTIANLSRDGVLVPGSGALGVDAAYQLFNQACWRRWSERTCSRSRWTTGVTGIASTTSLRTCCMRLLDEQPDRVPDLHRRASSRCGRRSENRMCHRNPGTACARARDARRHCGCACAAGARPDAGRARGLRAYLCGRTPAHGGSAGSGCETPDRPGRYTPTSHRPRQS
jgi:hypothetical protein